MSSIPRHGIAPKVGARSGKNPKVKKISKAFNWVPILVIAVLVGGGFYLYNNGFFKGQVDRNDQSGSGQGFGYAVSLSVAGMDPVTGSKVNTNAELFTSSDSQLVGETQSNAALASLGTSFPNTFSGYIMMGNDDQESTTDRGTDYYYRKEPVSWTNYAGLVTKDKIVQAEEGTPTWTGYDDGAVESTPNISVGSGARVTTLSLKFEVSNNAYIGNPDPALNAFSRERIAYCVNESTAGTFKEIAPTSYARQLDVPGNISAATVIGKCYVLPLTWVDDDPMTPEGSNYKFDDVIEAAAGQNPGVTTVTWHSLWDLTWVKNDAGVWQPGWYDESTNSVDTDAGMVSFTGANMEQVWFS